MLRACLLLVVIALPLAACGPGSPGGPTMSGRMNAPPASSHVVSTAILEREPVANRTTVKHILIGWADLADSYQGGIDSRASARSKRDAEDRVEQVMAQIAGGADFDVLVVEHSEDRGSTANPDGYEVFPGAQLVLEFRQLGLRLQLDEVGVVQTTYGFHIMKRVK